MKKLLVLVATLAMVVVSASPALAQGNAVAQDQYDEKPGGTPGEPVTATGVVEALGPTAFAYGTHSLEGSGYVIESDAVDLSAYEGQEVAVSGTLVYEEGELEGGPPLINVESVEPTDDDGGTEEVSGTVLEVREGSILVEDATGGRYDFAITGNTAFTDGVFYAPEETPPRAPNAADLAPGLEVSVAPAGEIATSFPAQGEAANITFLSPWYGGGEDPTDPPNNGGDVGSGNSGSSGSGGSGSGGSAAAASGGILPDTGGASLVALGAGALLIGGGLLARRIVR